MSCCEGGPCFVLLRSAVPFQMLLVKCSSLEVAYVVGKGLHCNAEMQSLAKQAWLGPYVIAVSLPILCIVSTGLRPGQEWQYACH